MAANCRSVVFVAVQEPKVISAALSFLKAAGQRKESIPETDKTVVACLTKTAGGNTLLDAVMERASEAANAISDADAEAVQLYDFFDECGVVAMKEQSDGTDALDEPTLQRRLVEFYSQHMADTPAEKISKLARRVTARSRLIGKLAAEAELNKTLAGVYHTDLDSLLSMSGSEKTLRSLSEKKG